MKYNRLAHTPFQFSAVGLGTWPWCSGYDWSNTSLPDVNSLVSAAIEAGINWADTAPVYEGCERALGHALKGRRDRFFIATKGGLVKNGSWTDHNLRTLQTQLESSLSALQTDYIDLYQIHYPDPLFPLADALEILFRAQQQGKIRAVGVCNLTEQQVNALPGQVASVQGRFSLINPGEKISQLCRQKGISFLAYGVLHGGLLSGKYRTAPNLRRADARNYFYKGYKGDSFSRFLPLVARVKQVAQKYGVTPAQIALAWALARSGGFVLAGAKTPAQVAENAHACTVCLTPQDCLFLEDPCN